MKRINISVVLLMLLGSWIHISAWKQESVDKLLILNKNYLGEWSPDSEMFLCLDVSDEELLDLDLSGITFWNCNLSGASFYRSILTDIVVDNSDCRGAHFDETKLDGAHFYHYSYLDGATFIGASLIDTSLEVPGDMNLENIDIINTNLTRVMSFKDKEKKRTLSKTEEALRELDQKLDLLGKSSKDE